MNYKELFHSTPTPIIVLNNKGIIELMNENARALFGKKDDSLVGTEMMKSINSSNDSFADFHKGLETKSNYSIKLENGSEINTQISSAVITSENENKYIFSFNLIVTNEQLTHDLKERVKEQLAILNVIDVLFRYSDIHEALANCLPAICDGWQFPESTVARITLSDGEIFATKNFIKTEWIMQASIEGTEEKIGMLEVGYRHEVPLYGGSVFLMEESRLIIILSRVISLFIKQWRVTNKIKEDEQLMKKITSQAPGNTYMFEIDETGHSSILFINKGTDEYNHSYNLEYLTKHPEELREILHEEDKVRFNDAMKAAYHSHANISLQYRMSINGVIRWRWLRAVPEKNKEGRVIWYGASQDITPIVNYITTTEQILFDIAHVIRRPISSILGLTDMIDISDFTEKELRDISGKLQIVAHELDKFLNELNQVYNKKREVNAAFNFDFSVLIDKRANLFDYSC